jgi:hypothetical protein
VISSISQSLPTPRMTAPRHFIRIPPIHSASERAL